jgi:hypothetical protein
MASNFFIGNGGNIYQNTCVIVGGEVHPLIERRCRDVYKMVFVHSYDCAPGNCDSVRAIEWRRGRICLRAK